MERFDVWVLHTLRQGHIHTLVGLNVVAGVALYLGGQLTKEQVVVSVLNACPRNIQSCEPDEKTEGEYRIQPKDVANNGHCLF